MHLRFYCGSLTTEPPCPETWEVDAPVDSWVREVVESRCPSCGSSNHQVEGRHEVIGHGLPLAVCFLIQDKGGLVLAVSRKDDPSAFGLPGGKVDPTDGETDPAHLLSTLQHAVAREVQEETGAVLAPGGFQVVYQDVCPGGADGRAFWQTVLTYHYDDVFDATTQEGEGVVAMVPWGQLTSGPFGHFNRKLCSYLREEPEFDPLTAPIEEVDAYLREHGGDPEAIGQRGAELVHRLMHERDPEW